MYSLHMQTLLPNKLGDGIPDLLLVPYQEMAASFNRHQPAAGDPLGDHHCTGIGRGRIVLRMNNQHRNTDLPKGKVSIARFQTYMFKQEKEIQ